MTLREYEETDACSEGHLERLSGRAPTCQLRYARSLDRMLR